MSCDECDDAAYFGFVSKGGHKVSVNDVVVIRMQVREDLEGWGRTQTGLLTAGEYSSAGRFSISHLEKTRGKPDVFAHFGETTKILVDDVDKARNWTVRWPLEITKESGWNDVAK